MARAKKAAADADGAELRTARDTIIELEGRIESLQGDLETREADLESANDRVRDLERDLETPPESDGELESMRDQLDSLAVAIESGRTSIPQTPAQWMRCLQAIAKGGEWEHGTWR
jgi:chromosome segregation ATPase